MTLHFNSMEHRAIDRLCDLASMAMGRYHSGDKRVQRRAGHIHDATMWLIRELVGGRKTTAEVAAASNKIAKHIAALGPGAHRTEPDEDPPRRRLKKKIGYGGFAP
jgi:hypothetical protein